MKYILPMLSFIFVNPALAAEAGRNQDEYSSLSLQELLQVEMPVKANVGSRWGARTMQDATVPIDVITASQLQSVGQMELSRALAVLVPGFNHPRPSIADGTDHSPPFTLRTLNPDQVLVLVNGKRLHQSSLLNINGTIGRGSSGVDLDTIPLRAVERVEVLRDGAAAQYGSDAIAGIINIVLKGYGHASETTLSHGRTDAGDGEFSQADLFYNLPLQADGFVNLTLELRDRNATNRAGPDPLDNGRINTHFGDPDAQDALLAMNAEMPVGDVVWYAHGNYDKRNSSAGAFFRRPGDPRNIPAIHPAGFLPLIEPEISDHSVTGGAKGLLDSGTRWDLSYTHGANDFHFYVNNSLNSSLGPDSPTSFDSGATRYTQQVVNFDFSHVFGHHVLAGGYEFRHENYQIRAGEQTSWQLGTYSPDYAGAQGFPGFRPENEVSATRNNHGAYVDLKSALTQRVTLVSAIRAEHHSDFDSTLNGKLALRWQAADQWVLRSSLSNGYRAPSLSQANFTSTAMIRNGSEIRQFGTFSVDHPLAKALGARPLKAEESLHYTAGFVYQPVHELTASVDFFQTDIDDRIMMTGYIADWNFGQLSPAASAILQQYDVEGAMYFTNAVATRTRGVDVRLDYKKDLANGDRLRVAGAFQRATTRIESVNESPAVLGVNMTDLVLDPYSRVTIEAGQPRDAVKIWAKYSWTQLDWVLNLNRYGRYASTRSDEEIRFGARWTLDTELAYRIVPDLTLAVGATNLFDAMPQEWGATHDNVSGSGKPVPYSAYAPLGYNGATYYLRIGFGF